MRAETVYLRILEAADIPRTTKWINDPLISDIMGYLPVLSLENQLDWYHKLKGDRSRFVFAICLAESDEHIGNAGLGNIDYVHRHAMLNIFIAGESHRGKGVGSQATRLLLEFAFNRLNMNKVHLRTSARFAQAVKMYESLGFVREGVMRQHYFSNGAYEDKIIYSILKSEFSQ